LSVGVFTNKGRANFLDGPRRREAAGGGIFGWRLGAGNFLFRTHCKIIEQQALPPA